ncbi:UNVERIFIED_ORG: anti-sigma factor ChrR (cupin superfamily) [Xanthomonas campestris]
MLINADFNSIVVVTPDDYLWVDSPQAGVRRVMLDRIGAEKARATSLVRYAPGSTFPSHAHPGGEEILVLEGVFSDELGDCPAGTYLRNPPGSRHAPASREGCLIMVKLRQMSANETATLRLDTNVVQVWEHLTDRRSCRVFESPEERVRIEQVEASRPLFPQAQALAEILVLGGELKLAVGSQTRILAAGTWVRAGGPDAHRCLASMVAGSHGATVYIKQGAVMEHPHLASADSRSWPPWT